MNQDNHTTEHVYDFVNSRLAAEKLSELSDSANAATLLAVADAVESRADELLQANVADLQRMDSSDPKYDRLLLTPDRIASIAEGMRAVAALPSPVGVELERRQRPNGMLIRKVTAPFGVIGVIYEARPNVSFDVFALCFRSGSAVVLKGGHQASETNAKAVEIIRSVLSERGVDPDVVHLMPDGHEATAAMLQARGFIDLIIPRGGRGLIDFVRENSRVPVIETGAGVCHTYFHYSGDIATGSSIILNAKTRRVSVCNALDTLVLDRSRLDVLPALCYALADKKVEIYADEEAYAALEGAYPYLRRATDEDFGREWLDYKMSIRTVENFDEAIDFINAHGSRHSECIVAENKQAVDEFQRRVDAACVYANVSTAFTDGGEFGLGAEIGISTQKLHARGPMGLAEIVTYKYLISGAGQIRPGTVSQPQSVQTRKNSEK
ncbi:MAG: glutamate-5-semialdehyde dehydrogenase [Muribaculaceae bacterium]|nr:glutamate-5-semialdehyde dehydrogenase [Muribaculaceae bacterium]